MRLRREHEAIEPALYIIGQKTEVGIHILPKSWTFTANLAKPFLKIFMAPLQFVELAQFRDPL